MCRQRRGDPPTTSRVFAVTRKSEHHAQPRQTTVQVRNICASHLDAPVCECLQSRAKATHGRGYVLRQER
jgi:hypothetical protein